MNKPKKYFVFKGTSDFCKDLVLSDDCSKMIKQKPDGFYDQELLESYKTFKKEYELDI